MAEEESLLNGRPRIKFDAVWTGVVDLSPWSHELQLLSWLLRRLEEMNAAPVLPDGLVGGNGAWRVSPTLLLVTPSGKKKGHVLREEDFVLVTHFDDKLWRCEYRSSSSRVRPSSDTPLLWMASLLKKKLPWIVHGHGLHSEDDALALACPISSEETLFSTPQDANALLTLARNYCNENLFLRRGHGFFLMEQSPHHAHAVIDRKLLRVLRAKL